MRTREKRGLSPILGDAVITTDALGQVTYLNAVAQDLTGWTGDAVIGKPLPSVFNIINGQSGQPVANPVEKVLKRGRVLGLVNHTVLIGKDGTRRPIEHSADPIRDGKGTIIGVVLVFHDIAERREAEKQLRRSEQQLTDFFENAAIALHWLGPDGTILRANQTELKLLGYSAEDYIGRHIAEVHVDKDVIADILKRLAKGETIIGREARLRCKDGSTRIVIINSNGLWEEGRFVHACCFTYDVTDLKQAEEAMRQGEERISSVVNHVLDGIITIDRHGVVQSFNPAAEKLFGYAASEIVGQNVNMLMPEPYRSEHDKYIANYVRTGQAKIIGIGREVEGHRKDGSPFPMDLAVSKFDLGEHHYFTGIVRDITERKNAEKRVYELLIKLQEADRRKDEFLATLAHELRNPLAPLKSSLELMKRADGNREVVEQSHSTMERQVQQMVRLVDDLLDLSRITHNKLELRKERVELAWVMFKAVEVYRPMVERAKHELKVTLPPEPIYLEADSVRLAQVFGNILGNACKYTEPGGKIWLTAERQGSDVVVSVKDTGTGIPPEKLDNVFDLFTQVDRSLERSEGGLGIGLTLVKRLVEMHGGSVRAKSEGEGRGSEFIVRLPIPIESPKETSPEPDATRAPAMARRILVVDDNRDAATSLALLLRIAGNETRTAYDGLEALDAAEKFRPDVVLLDVGLPKLNGHDVCRRIREQPWGKNMMLVALTGWGREEDRRKSQSAGFDHHVVKPVDYDALSSLLGRPSRRAN